MDAISQGVSYRHAAAAAGISFDTFNRWRQKGENGDPDYCDFCVQVAAAEAQAVQSLVGRINEASRRDWKAAAWLLQRRFPEEWGDGRRTNNPSLLDQAFASLG